MSKINELRDMRAGCAALARKFHNESKSILGRATAANRDLTPGEESQINDLVRRGDEHMVELSKIDAELVHAERAIEARADDEAMSTLRPRVVPPAPIHNGPFVMTPSRSAPAGAGGGNPRAINNVFAGRELPADPYSGRFKSLGEFMLTVAAGGNDSRLIRNATMTEAVGADGGYAVPLQFMGPILDAALSREVVRPRSNLVPMTSKSAAVGVFDFQDGTSGKRAGLQLLWGAEAAALTEQKGKLRELTLNAHKGSIFVRVSNELANDAPAFDAQFTQAAVAAVAAGLDLAFVNGTGAGQPLGILNAPTLITVTKVGAQAANTLLLQNLADMAGRLTPSSFANSTWLVHPTVIPKLYMLSYTVSNLAGSESVGGSHVQAVQQDASGQLRIFGRPVEISDACSALSSAGDVILADLSRYVVGLRADATIAKDQSRYFDSDELAFRLTLRCDGQPQDAAAMKLRDGSNTTSAFVALGAR